MRYDLLISPLHTPGMIDRAAAFLNGLSDDDRTHLAGLLLHATPSVIRAWAAPRGGSWGVLLTLVVAETDGRGGWWC